MATLGVIIGALLSAIGISWFTGGKDNDPSSGERNNQFGRWEDNQPYNP